MTKPTVSYRRIDRLRDLAFKHGFTNSDAKQFGKLSKTATWEALLELYLVEGESLDTVNDGDTDNFVYSVDNTLDSVDSVDNTPDNQVESLDTVLDGNGWTSGASLPLCGFSQQESTGFSFLHWVDLGQLIALALASAGVFVLAMSMWRQINPLNLFPSPVRINIQIGTKL